MENELNAAEPKSGPASEPIEEMGNPLDGIDVWFRDRPNWLQKAAGLLLNKAVLTDEDVEALLDKCLREGDSENTTTAATFPMDAFHSQATLPLRLCAIGNVKGINALAPRSPLDFGEHNMAVVYGANGSGKSGYVRILKHMCGARNPGTLHPNVFADDVTAQSADITYRTVMMSAMCPGAPATGFMGTSGPLTSSIPSAAACIWKAKAKLLMNRPHCYFFPT